MDNIDKVKLHSESGLELIARLTERPSFQHFEENLFPNGLHKADIIEISGNVSSGKTKLLTQLIAKCILPVKYCGVQINGLDANVLLINTDNHFKASYLLNEMRHLVYEAYKTNGIEKDQSHDKYIDYLLNRSLEGLKIINCYMNKQFMLTLQSLDNILLENKKIAMVVIDGITPFYWIDRDSEGITTYDMYTKKLLEILKKNAYRFNVVTVYTKSSDFVTKNQTVAGKYITKFVNYRISLKRIEELNSFKCYVTSANDKIELRYEITDSHIVWLQSQPSESKDEETSSD